MGMCDYLFSTNCIVCTNLTKQFMNLNNRHIKSQTILIFVVSVILFITSLKPAVSQSIDTDFPEWKKINTRHTIIYYQCVENLETFNKKVTFNGQTKKADLAHTISNKIDAIFEKSQQLLGMHGFVPKIQIKVYKDKQQLNDAYFKIYQKKSDTRAWYTHEELTIFIQLDDLHNGMLAHEFAHAIIDHFMIIPPPGETAEILARYVDKHLVNAPLPGSRKAGSTFARGYSIK